MCDEMIMIMRIAKIVSVMIGALFSIMHMESSRARLSDSEGSKALPPVRSRASAG